ncbi:MAG TPA: trimethylamine methyltransferase family protein [Acidimicrobiia bacterium]|nr:trimethylamine methyltransferase family protein [Acidimicrobiia bacterium]
MDSPQPAVGRPARRGRRGEAGRLRGTPRSTEKYRRLRNPIPPVAVFSEDQIASIHDRALDLLSEHGMRVLLPAARRVFAGADCLVGDDLMVRIEPETVGAALESVPARFEMVSRTGARDLTFGGDSVAFLPVGGPPHIMDLDRGKRPGTLADFELFTKLTQAFDVIHMISQPVEAQDVPTNLRHYACTRAVVTLSDKIPFVYSRGGPQVAECFDMLAIAHGVDRDAFERARRCYTVINTNSPRQLDIPMCNGIIDFAAANQVSVITPFTLAGAMAPVTIPGALVLQHAEALAAITLAQLVAPGSAQIYGAFTSNVDMRSGSPAFGTPEAVIAALGSGQLARHVGMPWRSSGPNASNVVDAQATYEGMMSLFGTTLGGANMVLHAAGWMEGGLSASPEKFILDVEVLQMLAEVFAGVDFDDDALAYDAIAGVSPGGHFFDSPHTMSRFDTAFYEPIVSDWSNFGQWTEAGGLDATQRANQVWKRVIAEFEAPDLDDAVVDELDAYIARRTADGGAPPES